MLKRKSPTPDSGACGSSTEVLCFPHDEIHCDPSKCYTLTTNSRPQRCVSANKYDTYRVMKHKRALISYLLPAITIALAVAGVFVSGWTIWAEAWTLRELQSGHLAAKDLNISVVLLSPHPIHYLWPSLLLFLPFIYWRFIRGTTVLQKTWLLAPLISIIVVGGYVHLQLSDYLSDIRVIQQLTRGAGNFLRYVHADLNGKLPDTIDDYNSLSSEYKSLRHPITGRPFPYSRLSGNRFTLCTVMRTDGHVRLDDSQEYCFVFEMRRQPTPWNSWLETIEGRELIIRF